VKAVGLAVAGLMVLAGTLFTLQGLGYVGGSAMSGERTWSIIGPILAGLGVALGIVLLQNRRA